jgi:ABC-type dipeptide/oligopeptide/nickel transport system permease component
VAGRRLGQLPAGHRCHRPRHPLAPDHGARLSLSIGIAVVAISVAVGVVLGLVAGFFKGVPRSRSCG